MSRDFIDKDVIARHTALLPRYTSYPTANHFTPAIGSARYREWLAELNAGAALSLYVHIPFCDSLCWYCACNTKAVRRHEPVAEYLTLLEQEIATVADLIPGRHGITHIHWGGGSPNILEPQDILRLGNALRSKFELRADAEFAVEIDPRLLSLDQADSFAAIGINRISIGVQDFDPEVQRAIGRVQSYEVTKNSVEAFRDRGVRSINVDLVYGLPHQSEKSVLQTLEQVLTLSPDRIAIFGYAHLPQRMHNQRLIDESALPGPMQRFGQSQQLAQMLGEVGYVQLGLDHFARHDDPLATQSITRNFQGYTTDSADALIGLGASAIGRLPQGYVQNATTPGEYETAMRENGVATKRGWALTTDDMMRAFVIERLMCDFTFSAAAVAERFRDGGSDLRVASDSIIAADEDGFIEPTADGFRLTTRGRPFVRNICARFDAYLSPDTGKPRHALSV